MPRSSPLPGGLLPVLSLCLLPGCRLLRPATIGAGPAGLLIPESGGLTPDAGVVLETRSLPPADKPFGFTTRDALTYHDTAATVSMWQWYVEGPQKELEPPADALWYTLLFPTLIFAPLASCEFSQGYGVIFQPSPHLPYGEAGLQAGLWSRPSSPDLKLDFTLGYWMGLGIRLGPKLDLGLRTSMEAPIIHALYSQPGTIISGGLILSTRREGLLRSRTTLPPRPPRDQDREDWEDWEDPDERETPPWEQQGEREESDGDDTGTEEPDGEESDGGDTGEDGDTG
jgi:hypothetical protein